LYDLKITTVRSQKRKMNYVRVWEHKNIEMLLALVVSGFTRERKKKSTTPRIFTEKYKYPFK